MGDKTTPSGVICGRITPAERDLEEMKGQYIWSVRWYGLIERAELSTIWAAWPRRFEIKTRHSAEPSHVTLLSQFETLVRAAGCTVGVQQVPTYGPGKRDFHDRRFVFQDETDAKKRITVLLTGGLDRYMDAACECSLVFQST
jgi:hypothetical protein